MGMNALFNNTNYITPDLPLRTGMNCCCLIAVSFSYFLCGILFRGFSVCTLVFHNVRPQGCQLGFLLHPYASLSCPQETFKSTANLILFWLVQKVKVSIG